MRCPDCQHDQKYRDGTRCGQCGYQFVFRKRDDKISDLALRQIIQRLSDHGQYAFTATQLALEICRYWRERQHWIGSMIFVIVIALVLFFVTQRWGLSVSILVISLGVMLGWSQWKKTALPFHKAHTLIHRYHRIHSLAGLADGMALQQPTAIIDLQELHYAPERILVVERNDLVDMLIRNRFHLTSKTIVLSRFGYPEWVAKACLNVLRRYPNTPIQLVHDASLRGFYWNTQLAADPHWILTGHPVTDLGLSRTILGVGIRLPWLSDKRFFAKSVFSTDHSAMLRAGRRVPIDCVGPKRLLSLLSAAIISGTFTLATANTSNDFDIEVDYG